MVTRRVTGMIPYRLAKNILPWVLVLLAPLVKIIALIWLEEVVASVHATKHIIVTAEQISPWVVVSWSLSWFWLCVLRVPTVAIPAISSARTTSRVPAIAAGVAVPAVVIIPSTICTSSFGTSRFVISTTKTVNIELTVASS